MLLSRSMQSLGIKSYSMFKGRSAFVKALRKFVSPNQTRLTNFSFLKSMTELHTLDISCCYFVSSGTLSTVLMFCPELKNLDTSGNVQFDAKHVIKILMNHPKLVWANVLGSALLECDDTYDCPLAMPNVKVLAMTPVYPATEATHWNMLFQRFPSVHVSAMMATTLMMTSIDESNIRVWYDTVCPRPNALMN